MRCKSEDNSFSGDGAIGGRVWLRLPLGAVQDRKSEGGRSLWERDVLRFDDHEERQSGSVLRSAADRGVRSLDLSTSRRPAVLVCEPPDGKVD